MILKLNQRATGMLNLLLRSPEFLPINDVRPELKPYAGKDLTAARQIAALKTWLEKRVFDQPGDKFPKYKEVGLKKGGVDRLKEMVVYYERLAGLPALSEMYCKLKDALDGKAYEEEDLYEEEDSEEEEPEAEKAKDSKETPPAPEPSPAPASEAPPVAQALPSAEAAAVPAPEAAAVPQQEAATT